MSTWQQDLYVQVQVRVQVYQDCTRVLVQVPSTASEAVTISTTNCRRLKFFAVSDNENLWLLRHVHVLCIPSVQTVIENRRRNFIGNLLNDEIFTVVL